MSSHHRGIVKFNDNETTRFLELYSMEKVLYDPTLDAYRDRDLRAAAADRISSEMNVPGLGAKEVIVKFKNLRSSYCQELKKIADSERSDDVYKPKVFWFEQMNSFIRPFVQQRPTTTTTTQRRQSESEIEYRKCSEERFRHLEPEIESLGVEEASSKIDRAAKREKRKTESHPSTSKCQKTSHEISFAASPIEVAANKDDSFDYFGKYVASMLRDIGQPNAARLQRNITDVIANALCPPEYPDHTMSATNGLIVNLHDDSDSDTDLA